MANLRLSLTQKGSVRVLTAGWPPAQAVVLRRIKRLGGGLRGCLRTPSVTKAELAHSFCLPQEKRTAVSSSVHFLQETGQPEEGQRQKEDVQEERTLSGPWTSDRKAS